MIGNLALVAALSLLAAPLAAQTAPPPAPPSVWPDVQQSSGMTEFRLAVANCWAVGALSPEARATRVTLRVRFDAAGRPLADTIRPLSAGGAAATELFESARRALLRCGMNGLPLPAALRLGDREADLTFDPTQALLR